MKFPPTHQTVAALLSFQRKSLNYFLLGLDSAAMLRQSSSSAGGEGVNCLELLCCDVKQG